jgi:N6-adenosine-specific RNA methylase IME4
MENIENNENLNIENDMCSLFDNDENNYSQPIEEEKIEENKKNDVIQKQIKETKETFDVILADPAYKYSEFIKKGKKKRCGSTPYVTMNKQELLDLDIQKISNPQSLLLIWSTSPKLEETFDIMKNWNYQFVCVLLVWKKIRKNSKNCSNVVGNYTLGNFF